MGYSTTGQVESQNATSTALVSNGPGVASDVLYLHPAKQEVAARYDRYIASPSYPIMPVGVLGLANLLVESGARVRGLNIPLEFLLDIQFDLRRWLRTHSRPAMIMVDMHWYEHSYGALDVARACKAIFPDTPIVLGGLTASRYAGSIVAQFSEVDYVIRGDAEEPLRLLYEAILSGRTYLDTLKSIPNLAYRDGHKVRQTAQSYVADATDLARLDFVSLDFLEHHQAYSAIQYIGAGLVSPSEAKLKGHWLGMGRGCIHNCSYCGGAKAAHRKLAGRNGPLLRSADQVVDDLKRLDNAGIHQVSLALDPCMMGEDFWRPLMDGLAERGPEIGLYNEFFQLPSQEFVEAFSSVADREHTEVALSPLSGSERVRRLNGKQFTDAELLEAVDWLAERELPLYVYFSINLPGETLQSFDQTIDLASEICRRYPPHLLRMINKCHTIDPASPMSENPKRYGIRVKYKSFMDYYRYCEATAWQARHVTRGEHRGFDNLRLRNVQVEQMARKWDAFAEAQDARCFPVPRGW